MDFQRARLYRWEREALRQTKNILTLEECQQLADDARKEFAPSTRITVATTVRHKRRGICRKTWSGYELHLPDHTRFPEYVLHECAHAVVGNEHAHDQHFVGTFINLLTRFLAYPPTLLRASAIDAGLRVE